MSPGHYPFKYLRAFAAYTGLSDTELGQLLVRAHDQAAPGDTYARSPDGHWLTISDLQAQAAAGSTPAAHQLRKVLEYAGDPIPVDPTPEALKRARAH